ncbi:MAG: hypothetical protein LC751_21620, partial [Actinobacteria bacterium]|nr:hypothetical protein [Actinomycetota bacterium]MCA1740719.1 hypothetical protein [Actinomycetota bacterium]
RRGDLKDDKLPVLLQFLSLVVESQNSLKTVRKGSRVGPGASILASRAVEIGLFDPFPRLLRLQLEAI